MVQKQEVVIFSHMLSDMPFLVCLASNVKTEFPKFLEHTNTKAEDYEEFSTFHSFAISPTFRIKPL